MKAVCKAIKKLWNFTKYNLGVISSEKISDSISCNKALMNSSEGDVYILFTGGSLRGKDLGWLTGRDIIATNLFFMSHSYQQLKIKHYTIIEQWSYELLKFMGFSLDMISLRGALDSKPTVWLSSSARHYINNSDYHFESNSKQLMSNLDIRYIKSKGDFISDEMINCDFSKPCNTAQGATVFTIFLAIYLGYKRIFLLGYDYGKQPMLLGHLYENWSEILTAKELNIMAGHDLHSLLKKRMEAIKLYASSNGVQILNVVDKGFSSNFFDEIDYVDLIKSSAYK